ncbi:zinc finger CCCH domain-containing protein 13-like isoform X1 [Hermetia illucens]|uniref:zinc finger CCCH domain-containing protein 13-like isoform X1 n=1 Tax=Hermetia illucens TaxID=343691 RepID=UPI0018CC41A3|nr:zinc finger CCCH domain-containing protein 13-like isoform X1 [Hermetia illucens]
MTNTEVDTNQNTQNNESCRCTENEGTSPSHVGGEKPSKHAVGETQNPYRNPSCYAVVERTKRYVNTIAGKNNENVALLKKIVRDSNSLIGYLKKVQEPYSPSGPPPWQQAHRGRGRSQRPYYPGYSEDSYSDFIYDPYDFHKPPRSWRKPPVWPRRKRPWEYWREYSRDLFEFCKPYCRDYSTGDEEYRYRGRLYDPYDFDDARPISRTGSMKGETTRTKKPKDKKDRKRCDRKEDNGSQYSGRVSELGRKSKQDCCLKKKQMKKYLSDEFGHSGEPKSRKDRDYRERTEDCRKYSSVAPKERSKPDHKKRMEGREGRKEACYYQAQNISTDRVEGKRGGFDEDNSQGESSSFRGRHKKDSRKRGNKLCTQRISGFELSSGGEEFMEKGRERLPSRGGPHDKHPPRGDPRDRIPPGRDPRDIHPPRRDPRDILPPRRDPRDIYPPGRDPRDIYPPKKDPRDILPPRRDPRDLLPHERPPRDLLPHERPPRDLLPHERPPRDLLPHERPPRDIYPPGRDPRDIYPPGRDPRDIYPPRRDPRDIHPPRRDPRDILPHERGPRDRLPPGRDPRDRLPPGRDPRDRLPPGRDPRDRLPPGRDPRDILPPGRDPRDILPPGRDPRDKQPPGRDPRDRQPPGRDPRDRQPPGRDPRDRQPPGKEPHGSDHVSTESETESFDSESSEELDSGYEIKNRCIRPSSDSSSQPSLSEILVASQEQRGKVNRQTQSQNRGRLPGVKESARGPLGKGHRPEADRRREPHGRVPYGREPYGREPYGRQPYGREPHGREPRGREPRGSEPHGREPRGSEPHGREPRGSEPHRREPRGSEPHRREPHGKEHRGRHGSRGDPRHPPSSELSYSDLSIESAPPKLPRKSTEKDSPRKGSTKKEHEKEQGRGRERGSEKERGRERDKTRKEDYQKKIEDRRKSKGKKPNKGKRREEDSSSSSYYDTYIGGKDTFDIIPDADPGPAGSTALPSEFDQPIKKRNLERTQSMKATDIGPYNNFPNEPDLRKVFGPICQTVFYTQNKPEDIISHIMKEVKERKPGEPFYMPYRFWRYEESEEAVVKLEPRLIPPPEGIKLTFNFKNTEDFDKSTKVLLPETMGHLDTHIKEVLMWEKEVVEMVKKAQTQYDQFWKFVMKEKDS